MSAISVICAVDLQRPEFITGSVTLSGAAHLSKPCFDKYHTNELAGLGEALSKIDGPLVLAVISTRQPQPPRHARPFEARWIDDGWLGASDVADQRKEFWSVPIDHIFNSYASDGASCPASRRVLVPTIMG